MNSYLTESFFLEPEFGQPREATPGAKRRARTPVPIAEEASQAMTTKASTAEAGAKAASALGRGADDGSSIPAGRSRLASVGALTTFGGMRRLWLRVPVVCCKSHR